MGVINQVRRLLVILLLLAAAVVGVYNIQSIQQNAASLVREHGVSMQVARNALAMLAANRYVCQAGRFASYRVTWQAIT